MLTLNRDVKVQDILTLSQLRVQRDRRLIFDAGIGLNKHYISSTPTGDLLELSNQSRRYSFPSMTRCNGEIVDIDLATLLLELS